eukprot:11659257-Alexandrium_andersonii.AAC.1
MSASLVGSEMCIRDSRCTLPRGPRRKWLPPETLGDSGRGDRSCRGPHAVSYTHLTLPTICSV